MCELLFLLEIKVHMDNEYMDNICCNMDSSGCKDRDNSGCKGMDKDNLNKNDKVKPPQQLL